jgi:hypothetical protein
MSSFKLFLIANRHRSYPVKLLVQKIIVFVPTGTLKRVPSIYFSSVLNI